jgi:hypothetical protein
MNNRLLDGTLYEVGAETLGTLAMMMLAPETDFPAAAVGPLRSVSVSFAGPFGGELIVSASATLLPHLAANMLALEDPSTVTLDQQEDALKELANVICGNVLPAIAGKEPVFRVDVPRLLTNSEAAAYRPSSVRASLFLDAGHIELALCVHEPTAAGTGA